MDHIICNIKIKPMMLLTCNINKVCIPIVYLKTTANGTFLFYIDVNVLKTGYFVWCTC